MTKNVFILKIVDCDGNEHSLILGENYSIVHMKSKNELKGFYEDNEFINQVVDYVRKHSIKGLTSSSLDFLIAEDKIIELSDNPFGGIEASCFYIMVNGNTISKFKPSRYSYDDITKVWETYKE
jgi:hypothetical protein